MKEVEELDDITPRAVRSAMAGTDIKHDVKMEEVTIAETEPKDRKRVNRTGAVFAAGPAFLGNMGSSGVAYYLSLGNGWAMGLQWHNELQWQRDERFLAPFRELVDAARAYAAAKA